MSGPTPRQADGSARESGDDNSERPRRISATAGRRRRSRSSVRRRRSPACPQRTGDSDAKDSADESVDGCDGQHPGIATSVERARDQNTPTGSDERYGPPAGNECHAERSNDHDRQHYDMVAPEPHGEQTVRERRANHDATAILERRDGAGRTVRYRSW
jgi:hypothetical protein